MKRRIAILLLICSLLSGFAFAETSEAPVEYEEVTVIQGTPSGDSGVNIRKKPTTDSAKVGTMSPGDICTVTGRSNDWYSVEFEGMIGYIRKDLLTVTQKTIQKEKIVEEPLAASCEGFAVSYMTAPNTKFGVAGIVRSNIPMVEVKITVYDLRQLENEAIVSQKFTHDANILEFDLSEFVNAPALLGLVSGEKKLTLSAVSANEEQVLGEKLVYISGKCADATSITSACDISATRGGTSAMLDDSYGTSWSVRSSSDVIKIRLPEDKIAGGLLMEWDKAPSQVQITLLNGSGEEIRVIKETNPYQKWNLFYDLEPEVRAIAIRSGDTDNGIVKLRIYEQGRISQVVQRWEDTPEKIDLMMVVPHMNDETLYYSGVLPKLSAQGYNVLVVYMTGDNRNKHAEALDCLWTAGVRIHPIFVGFMDYKVDSYAKAEWLWGKENTYRAIIGLIRKYKPNVVLTQDWNGEYGHNQHIMTSRYTVKSVEVAGDENVFPDIAEQYGVWDVPKLYLHLWDESKRLDLHFDQPMEELGGRTPMQMAFIAFDKHQSQIKRYSLLGDGVTYDCTWFSLYRSTVGEDVARDSFFEHLE